VLHGVTVVVVVVLQVLGKFSAFLVVME